MLAIPALPTENLYKFLALGGLIISILSMAYYVTEQQKVGVDTIRLNTTLQLYNLKINNYNKATDELSKAYDIESKRIAKEIERLQKDKSYMAKNKGRIIRYYQEDNKPMLAAEYEKVLQKQSLDAIHYFNQGIRRENKKTEGSEIDKIKLDEQSELININTNYLRSLGIENLMIIILGLTSSIHGFLKWQEMQNISDELSKAQLAKAKAELDNLQEKKKIILL